MLTLYNPTSDSGVFIVFVNFSKPNFFARKAYFTLVLNS